MLKRDLLANLVLCDYIPLLNNPVLFFIKWI